MNDLLERLRALPASTSLGSILPLLEGYAIAAASRSQPPSEAPAQQQAVPMTPQTKRLLELLNYPDSFLVTGRDASILLDLSESHLATMRSERRPPPFIKGRPVHYTLASIRQCLKDKEDQSKADIAAASLKNIRRMTTVEDTFPVFKYESGLQLGYEAAADYQQENHEEAWKSVDILCLGEFKHMKLGQELLQSPLPPINPEVAKDFDTATWLFLELTNGKPLRTNEVIQALRHLRDSGNDLNQPNNLMQKTAAHMLAEFGEKLSQQETSNLMGAFLANGLNHYAEDYQGKSALDLAPIGGYMEQWEKASNRAEHLANTLAVKPEIKSSKVKKGI